jgi:hypothetical protein
MLGKITVEEWERKFFEKEDVRAVVRAGRNELVSDYTFERKASGNVNLTSFMNQRVLPTVGNFEVAIVDGNSNTPHGRTKIETLRNSYEK